ncbi:MAG: sensor domain-containing diguanylate cyclase [Candidatus Aminicenantes bacterium]|nr:sensor domain-containing diguanylate cyclase [Candidatus Aminicenantes bacterium]
MDVNSRFLQHMLEEVDEGIYFTDRHRSITFWNKSAERISGFTKNEVLGKNCSANILIHVDEQGQSLCTGLCPLAKTIMDRQPRQNDIFLHHKDGHRIPVRVRVFPILDENQQVIGAAEMFVDSSQKLDLQTRLAELQQIAMTDHLTGVANRLIMENHLQTRLQELNRFNWPFGIIFFDIDDFKALNDQNSHRIGDKVLKMTARSLQANIRSIDQVGRWGGEEFIVILRNANLETLSKTAAKLRLLVEKSFFWKNEKPILVTLSGGATLARPEDTVQSLVERADRLMYQSKRAGKNTIRCG